MPINKSSDLEVIVTAPATQLQFLELDSLPSAPLRPPLKWAGGKRWLIPRLLKLYSPHKQRRLVEPFVGGLAVALGLSPKRALLNDINPHLINFYNQIRSKLVIDGELRNEREFYLQQRELFNSLVATGDGNSRQCAALFYYLNRTGFNGLCRFNSKGGFNVPFGKYAQINYCRDFLRYQSLLGSWEFTCLDFEELVLEENDFLYVDPPYDVEFTTYSKGGFSWEDQERLVSWLAKFSGPVVASNQATERIVALYKSAGFAVETLPAPRRIACNGDRSPALEMLAVKGL